MSDAKRTLNFQCLAEKLPLPVLEHKFHPTRRWRADLAWPDQMVLAEIDGGTWVQGRHTRPQGFENDCEKLNTAVLMGWRVLRFTTAMVEDGRAVQTIKEVLGDS